MTIKLERNQPTERRSFMVMEGSKVQAICPLNLETQNIDGKDVKVLAFDTVPGPAPALRNGLPTDSRRRLQATVLGQVDAIAVATGAVRVGFRGSPLASAYVKNSELGHNDFIRGGYLDVGLSTQILEVTSPEPELLSGMRKGHRSDIKRASKLLDTEVFDRFTLTRETFNEYCALHAKAAGRITRPPATFDLMYEWVKSGLAILAGAKLAGRWVGFIHTNVYKGAAYYGSSANDPEFRELPISHAIQWAVIQWLAGNGVKKYELGIQQYGPQLHDTPSDKDLAISLFKRGFGGESVLWYRGEKYYSTEFYRSVWIERVERYGQGMKWNHSTGPVEQLTTAPVVR